MNLEGKVSAYPSISRTIKNLADELEHQSEYLQAHEAENLLVENSLLKRRILLDAAASEKKVRVKWKLGYRVDRKSLGCPGFETDLGYYERYLNPTSYYGSPGQQFRLPTTFDAYISPVLYRTTSKGLFVRQVTEEGDIRENKTEDYHFRQDCYCNLADAVSHVLGSMSRYLTAYDRYLEILAVFKDDLEALIEAGEALKEADHAVDKSNPVLQKVDALLSDLGEDIGTEKDLNVIERSI